MKKAGGDDSGAWVALAASEIGTSHTRKNLPCQDASRVAIAKGGLVIGAIADGIGSSEFSDEGARVAVDTAVEYLLGRASDLMARNGHNARDCCKHALTHASVAIKALAKKHDRHADAYACTLIIVLTAPEWMAALSVGDGFVAWRPAASDTHEVLIPPDKSEFVNYTSSITSSDIMETLRFEFRNEAPACALASSDGLLYLVLESETWKPHAPFFSFIESYVMAEGMDNARLQKLLRDPQIDALTDDDKSLLMICSRQHVRPAPATREVTAEPAENRSVDA